MSRQLSPTRPTVGSGVHQLDQILGGGLTPDRVYLVEGNPGAGKTTLALQFLLEGVRQGERGLYVTLSETADELAAVARSHGWSLDGLSIHELVDPAQGLEADAQYTMFQPSEVEMGEMTRAVLEKVESENPRRVVFDSLSEMRLLAQTPLRYRRQILGLKQFFVGRDCTVLLLDDKSSFHEDLQLQSIAHGVISLEQMLPEYGSERRRLRIIKMRGIDFDGGYHDFAIRRGGALPQVFGSDTPPRGRRGHRRSHRRAPQQRQRGGGRPGGRRPRARVERAPGRPRRRGKVLARHSLCTVGRQAR